MTCWHKRKVFRHRALNAEVNAAEIPSLARAALDDGARASERTVRSSWLGRGVWVSVPVPPDQGESEPLIHKRLINISFLKGQEVGVPRPP